MKKFLNRKLYPLRRWLHDEFGLHQIKVRQYGSLWKEEQDKDGNIIDVVIGVPYRECSYCGHQFTQSNVRPSADRYTYLSPGHYLREKTNHD